MHPSFTTFFSAILFFAIAVCASSSSSKTTTSKKATSTPAAETFKTPEGLTQCKPYNLTWSGGVEPFTLYVYPGCNTDATTDTPLHEWKNINGHWAKWTVNLAAGKDIQLVLVDAKGDEAYTDDVTIDNSTTTSCLKQNTTILFPPNSGGTPTTASNVANTGLANFATGGPSPTSSSAGFISAQSSLLALAVGALVAVGAASL